MSRRRRVPAISEGDAFDAICYFEEAKARNKKEWKYFNLAVLAFREVIVMEQRRDKFNDYIKNKRETDPEFAEKQREYGRKYYEEHSEQINERKREKRKEAKENVRR